MIKFRMKPGRTFQEVVELAARRGENVFALLDTNRIGHWYRYTPEGIKRKRSGRFGVIKRADGEIIMDCIKSTKIPNERDYNELFQRSLYLGYLLGKLNAITIEEDNE